MSKAPPSDGQTAAEKRRRGEKCFVRVRCAQERGSADGKTEAVLAEHVHCWRLMGEDQQRNVERQERGLGLEGQERRMPAVLPGSGREQRCNEGSDCTDELNVFSPQIPQERGVSQGMLGIAPGFEWGDL